MSTDAAPPRRSRRSSGAVTLHDVARLAGVAPITASRALNSPEQVSEEVRRKVGDAVARTGYVPNLVAGGLASRRSRLVAAVVPTVAGPVFLRTVQALTETLAGHGYQLMLGQTGYRGSREDALLEAIIGRRPDGIVLTGILHSAAGRRQLLASRIPVVETWDLTPTPIDMLVGFSHEQVGEAVAHHLQQRGRQRLALITGDDERALRRRDGFVAAARRLGLADPRVVTVPAPTTVRSGREALADLFAADAAAADALFCSSDLLAIGVLTEARCRSIAVPEDVAVVGFGDLEFAADLEPALTTVRVNGEAIGQQAAQFIIDRAAGRPIAEPVIDIGHSIVVRDSG
ncbi:LacI family DNA-binding transcriptional regulator [Piscinibacter sakaiensis]|uniref:LacI family DNA-binding transcriptional regulator n=1 Tax=Piscinibacter sakaiensis TaxID=1547922 RepID=UPI003AAB31CE